MNLNIDEAILLFTTMALEIHQTEQDALTKAAEILLEESKAEIGVYQGSAGPYQAWAPLAQSTQDDRVAKGYSADEPLLRNGDLRDSLGMTVGDHEAMVGSNSDVAVYQEMGTPTIPPRSFLGGAAVRKKDEIEEQVGKIIVHRIVK